jgi:hypothetical protein
MRVLASRVVYDEAGSSCGAKIRAKTLVIRNTNDDAVEPRSSTNPAVRGKRLDFVVNRRRRREITALDMKTPKRRWESLRAGPGPGEPNGYAGCSGKGYRITRLQGWLRGSSQRLRRVLRTAKKATRR